MEFLPDCAAMNKFLVEKSVHEACSIPKLSVRLTTFDESKCLNYRKDRVTTASYFGGEKET